MNKEKKWSFYEQTQAREGLWSPALVNAEVLWLERPVLIPAGQQGKQQHLGLLL